MDDNPTGGRSEADALALNAEITKLNFLLESLWLSGLIDHGKTPEDVRALSEDLLASWETGPEQSELDQLVAKGVSAFCARLLARLHRRSPGGSRR